MDDLLEEVKRDVDELSREHPQWKIPIVSVLYDKSAAMIDFNSKGWTK